MKMKRENLKSREFLQSKKKKIVQAWNGRLKQHLPFKDGTKLSATKKEQEKGTDLLSIILEVDVKNEKDLLKKIISILKRIRSSSYSISNFSLEAYCLEEAVLQVLSEDNAPDGQLLQLYNEVRKDIFILTQIVLQQSADVYEYAIENGERAFCYFNCDGEILYTNDTMLSLMGVGELSKREELADFFAEPDSDFVQDLICGKLGKQGILRILVFKNSKGKRLPVGAEISPIIVQGKRVGGYSSLIDISKPMESQQKVYDKSPLGIIKINKKFKFLTLQDRHLSEEVTRGQRNGSTTRGDDTREENNVRNFLQFSATVADKQKMPSRVGDGLEILSKTWTKIPFPQSSESELGQTDDDVNSTINSQLAVLKEVRKEGEPNPAALVDALTLATFQQ